MDARFRTLLPLLVCGWAAATAASEANAPGAQLADAHVHLSAGSAADLERLVDKGVVVVRDCGGDLAQLKQWRDEIASGARRGPQIYFCGPLLDGPKPDANWRRVVTTPREAEDAVDALAAEGVDFIKTHSAIPPEAFFATVRRAKERGLKVAAHLPQGVPAWTAAEAGVASIEHAAESLAASPIYAGYAKDAAAALEWWLSPAGDEAIQRLVKTGVTIVPTLVRYEAAIAVPADPKVREARAAMMPKLLQLIGRMHRAGIPLLVGSDLVGVRENVRSETGPEREIQLLMQAGLTEGEARAAADPGALRRWFAK
jgi:imidazolonepropionase-like amidohydrolase